MITGDVTAVAVSEAITVTADTGLCRFCVSVVVPSWATGEARLACCPGRLGRRKGCAYWCALVEAMSAYSMNSAAVTTIPINSTWYLLVDHAVATPINNQMFV